MSTLARPAKVAALLLLLAVPQTARPDPGLIDIGVTLRGTAFGSNSVAALRIRFRLMVFDREEGMFATGFFDCHPRAGAAAACPGTSGTASVTFGYQDMQLGPVSGAHIDVAFPDGSSCVFSGVTPLPVPSNTRLGGGLSPVVSIAGAYTCQDAQGAPTTAGGFFTAGGPGRTLPKCKGARAALCRPL